ncbi:TPA: DUF262 domain-containing protein [Aeromonas hydrophila]|nr:DUF262 domain-containing protein [Aeromonas hydrophila]HAT2639099.1 DUF262 domain-containing protein [Aeromonas hydrophila]HAT3424263.1 DUF262 domain-containing protein [Aeromonas hydrophila]HAT3534261.1 DUF262 domain-containing protein [Aeromonas hydrophila]
MHKLTDEQLMAVIRPLPTAVWESHFRFSRIEEALGDLATDYGGLELNPDFQRGHVWSEAQQVHYIENAVRGVIASSGLVIQFNCPNWNHDNPLDELPDGFQCLDGLQRLTAITRFNRGEIQPFGLHVDQLKQTRFSPSDMNVRVAVHCYTRKRDLLEHYLAINAGGTPHNAEEIARVKSMISVE